MCVWCGRSRWAYSVLAVIELRPLARSSSIGLVHSLDELHVKRYSSKSKSRKVGGGGGGGAL